MGEVYVGILCKNTPQKIACLGDRPMCRGCDWNAGEIFNIPEQRELIFHDTVPLPEERLPEARKRAARQKEAILDYFRQRYSMSFTPRDVYNSLLDASLSSDDHYFVLLTSVRRAITDLTKEGKLTKCDYSERREGGFGHPNRTWRYTRNFINPINPPKK
jgi:hypothetical protein